MNSKASTVKSRKYFLSFLWGLLLAHWMTHSDSFGGKWFAIEPDVNVWTVLEINGKEREYYRLDPGERMMLDLNQYSQYRII